MKDSIKNTIANFHADESGATATEYIILLTLVACFVIAVVRTFGGTLSEKYAAAQEGLQDNVVFN